MFVEITGGGFANKGAEIMLRTVVAELSRALPGVQSCMRPTAPYERMLSLGVRPILTVGPRHRRNLLKYAAGQLLNHFISRRFCDQHNLAHPLAVDALVDISGYAFGDKWNIKSIHKLRDHARSYHRRNKPVVLLPQMFGPFEKSGYAQAISDALQFVDLAYARDNVSFEYLARAAGRRDAIKLAPDISIFTEPGVADPAEIPQNPFCCVVPNVRMLAQGASDWGGTYLNLLNRAITQVLKSGLEVVLLVHATVGGDLELTEGLLAKVPGQDRGRCRIYSDEDPLKLKAVLWKSSFLISSRYHSLVGALSGAVPVIMLGWAHKYAELARDFGMEQFVLSPTDAESKQDELIAMLMDCGKQAALRTMLAEKKRAMLQPNRTMWQETAACLKAGL